MSGIVGSRFNIRGSGLVGSLGTDGQVFTSSGAGAGAVFEAAGGGAWNHLVTTTASDDDYIEFDTTYITSTYKVYKIIISHLVPEKTGDGPQLAEFWCQFKHGGSYQTSGYQWSAEDHNSGQVTSTSSAQIQLTPDNLGGDTGENSGWEITLDDPLGTANNKGIRAHSMNYNQDGELSTEWSVGGSEVTTALDALKFYIETGEIESGRFSLYGITT